MEKDKKPVSEPRGLVVVITGNGKGKTTAAFGMALRAIGHGARVMVIQFLKGRDYGEYLAAAAFLPSLEIHRAGLDSFVIKGNPAPIDIEMARQGFALARQAVVSGKYDLVILDEINVALDFGLIPLEAVTELIKAKPPRLDLVLTGRHAPAEVVALADTVSEIAEIKHHYQAGIKDRAGMEY